MAKTRSTLVLILLFMWTGVPALRCLVPDQSLSPEEQACCKAMAGQCGEMGNHSCCKKIEVGTQPALAAARQSVPQLLAIGFVPIASGSSLSSRLPSTATIAAAHSPPSPPLSMVTVSSVLRI